MSTVLLLALLFSVVQIFSPCEYTSCFSGYSMSYSLDHISTAKGLKVVHVNARSLLQHFDELHVSFLNGSFDIIIFTESWLHSNCTDTLVNIDGYNLYRLDRQTPTASGSTKKGGGIAIYIRASFCVTTWSALDISDKDLEVLSLSCKLGHHKKINLTAVYRPPGGYVQSALDRIEQIVNTIRQTSSGDIVIAGDFNIDLLNDNAHSKKISQLANACRVEQLITSPTRISKKTSTLIDHLFCSSSHHALSGTINSHITDHLPIFIVLKKSRTIFQFREVSGRSYRDFDEASFCSDIQGINLDDIFASRDPEQAWDRLFIRICQIIDIHCPIRTLRIQVGKPNYLTDYI